MELDFQTAFIVGNVMIFPDFVGDVQPLPSPIIEGIIIGGTTTGVDVSMTGIVDDFES